MTIDTINIFKSIASAHNSGLTALETIKTHIAVLREAKIVMGKSIKTCAYRVQCVDAYAIAFPKVAKKTRDNYVTAIVDAVNNGTEFSFSASKGKASKGKGGKANESTSDVEKMIAALLNVWKMSDVASDVLVQIETTMADGTTLIDAISDVLKFHGEDLPTE